MSLIKSKQILNLAPAKLKFSNEGLREEGAVTKFDADGTLIVDPSMISSASELFINKGLRVAGDLQVDGEVTSVNTAQLNVEDNIVQLNTNVTGAPSVNAGLEVKRGDASNVSILWNEESDTWTFSNDGESYSTIASKEEMDANEADRDATIKTAHAEHDAEISKREAARDGDIADAKANADKALVDAKATSDAEIATAKANADQATKDAAEDHDAVVSKREAARDGNIADAKANADKALVDAKATSDAEIATALTNANDAIVAAKAEHDSADDEAAKAAADALATEKGRIDAMLVAATADTDTFAEVVNLVNSIDTTNDEVFAGYVISNDAAIAAENAARIAADAVIQQALDIQEAKEAAYEISNNAVIAAENAARIAEDAVLTASINLNNFTLDSAITDNEAARDGEIADAKANADKALADAKATSDAEIKAAASVVADATAGEKAERVAAEAVLTASINLNNFTLDSAITDNEAARDKATVEAKTTADKALVDAKATSDAEIATALANANDALVAAKGEHDSVVDGAAKAAADALATETGRIDAILLASDADKNSFAEIVTLINSVDLENDTAFAGYVISNDAIISKNESDRDGEIADAKANADKALVDAKATSDAEIATAKANVIQATKDAAEDHDADISKREAARDGEIADAKANADKALVDAKATSDAEIATAKANVIQATKDAAEDHDAEIDKAKVAADSAISTENAARVAAEGVIQVAVDLEESTRIAAIANLDTIIGYSHSVDVTYSGDEITSGEVTFPGLVYQGGANTGNANTELTYNYFSLSTDPNFANLSSWDMYTEVQLAFNGIRVKDSSYTWTFRSFHLTEDMAHYDASLLSGSNRFMIEYPGEITGVIINIDELGYSIEDGDICTFTYGKVRGYANAPTRDTINPHDETPDDEAAAKAAAAQAAEDEAAAAEKAAAEKAAAEEGAAEEAAAEEAAAEKAAAEEAAAEEAAAEEAAAEEAAAEEAAAEEAAAEEAAAEEAAAEEAAAEEAAAEKAEAEKAEAEKAEAEKAEAEKAAAEEAAAEEAAAEEAAAEEAAATPATFEELQEAYQIANNNYKGTTKSGTAEEQAAALKLKDDAFALYYAHADYRLILVGYVNNLQGSLKHWESELAEKEKDPNYDADGYTLEDLLSNVASVTADLAEKQADLEKWDADNGFSEEDAKAAAEKAAAEEAAAQAAADEAAAVAAAQAQAELDAFMVTQPLEFIVDPLSGDQTITFYVTDVHTDKFLIKIGDVVYDAANSSTFTAIVPGEDLTTIKVYGAAGLGTQGGGFTFQVGGQFNCTEIVNWGDFKWKSMPKIQNFTGIVGGSAHLISFGDTLRTVDRAFMAWNSNDGQEKFLDQLDVSNVNEYMHFLNGATLSEDLSLENWVVKGGATFHGAFQNANRIPSAVGCWDISDVNLWVQPNCQANMA